MNLEYNVITHECLMKIDLSTNAIPWLTSQLSVYMC